MTIALTKEQGVSEVANIVRNASEKEEIMKVQTRPAFFDNINTSKSPSKLDTVTDKTVELQKILAVLLAIPVIVNLVQNQFGTNPLPIWRFAIVLVFISALMPMLMQWTKLCTPFVVENKYNRDIWALLIAALFFISVAGLLSNNPENMSPLLFFFVVQLFATMPLPPSLENRNSGDRLKSDFVTKIF